MWSMIISDTWDRQYSVVVLGIGFGSPFFVHRLLLLRPMTNILMLERDAFRSWETQVAENRVDAKAVLPEGAAGAAEQKERKSCPTS